jgi:hypothetical protein
MQDTSKIVKLLLQHSDLLALADISGFGLIRHDHLVK